MQELITKTIDLQKGNPEAKRLEILEYFEKTWAVDELLYTQLKSDDIFIIAAIHCVMSCYFTSDIQPFFSSTNYFLLK